MKKIIRRTIRRVIENYGYNISLNEEFPPDFSEDTKDIVRSVKEYTMTSPERILALKESVEYIVKHNIPGDIVECGVWKGGSIMVVAKTLMSLEQADKKLYLFDTYEGMSDPNEFDIEHTGLTATELLDDADINNSESTWCYAPIDEVKKSVYSTGYNKSNIHFIKGKVEDTIPINAPESISILRLDTDFYESSMHELVHLFPRLTSGGVLIIDDYGYWQGQRKAVDEYFSKNNIQIFLSRIDNCGRVGIKN